MEQLSAGRARRHTGRFAPLFSGWERAHSISHGKTLQSVGVKDSVFKEVAEALGEYDPERELVAIFLQAGGVHWFRVKRVDEDAPNAV